MIELDPSAPPEVAAAAARSWIEERLPADWLAAVRTRDRAAVRAIRADPERTAPWYAQLGGSGLATPTWPRAYGGLELGTDAAGAIADVLMSFDAGRPEEDFVGLALAGATILAWGSEQQKRRFLPPLARGEERWCQLFSEPGAGSDLAGLGTRAVAQPEGGWLVDGQKVWSSYAHIADFGLLMARTDPDVPKHRGISYFLLDLRTSGVDVRPLRQMTGDAEFTEVFLTGVAVPPEALLGPLGSGWSVAITTLLAERSGITGRPAIGPERAAVLARRARDTGGLDDPVLRDRLLGLYVEEKALQMTTIRAYVEGRGGSPGAEGSIRKLASAQLDEAAGTLAADLEPCDIVAWDSAGPMPDGVHAFLAMKTISIAGGTSEIQRNIIGERVLGLPKEDDPDRDVPFARRRRG
jgi:alkylation response protein AidB-like acyl-CoA dehydrogenase